MSRPARTALFLSGNLCLREYKGTILSILNYAQKPDKEFLMGKIRNRFGLDRDQVVMIVVDVQEKLIPAMNERICGRVVQHINMLLEGFSAMDLPVIATEQYPRGLGPTITELAESATRQCIEKVSFSCCDEANFMEALGKTGRKQVLLVGMEAHVCVYQTMLDLLDQGYQVHLVRDAICSRFKSDYHTAITTAPEMGAVLTTTEMALFQLLKVSGTAEFKVVSGLSRRRTG